ncbi:transcriptional regulator [Streptomyces fumigatiscleroticus]|nr:transcriptional regulator [Streptomyces fumigatiscleroticus]
MVSEGGGWTFLTNHARVLLAIARDPTVQLRQVAASCRITERTAQAIVADLEQAGYLRRRRVGRRNQYTLHLDGPFRHPAEGGVSVRTLLEIFADLADRDAGTAPPPC